MSIKLEHLFSSKRIEQTCGTLQFLPVLLSSHPEHSSPQRLSTMVLRHGSTVVVSLLCLVVVSCFGIAGIERNFMSAFLPVYSKDATTSTNQEAMSVTSVGSSENRSIPITTLRKQQTPEVKRYTSLQNITSSLGSNTNISLLALVNGTADGDNRSVGNVTLGESHNSDSYSSERQGRSKHKQKYALDTSRYIVWKPVMGNNPGFNNQWQCLQLAATLGVQYNRTLWLDGYGYQGSKHSEHRLKFHQIYDINSSTTRVPLRFSNPFDQLRVCKSNIPRINSFQLPIQPELILGSDPNPNATCIYWNCHFGNLHHVTPPTHFPQVDETLLPLAPSHRKLAQQVLAEIRAKAGPKILGIHIRRGDNMGYPLINCSETAFPHASMFYYNRAHFTFCSKTHPVPLNEQEELSWDTYLHHLIKCDHQIPHCKDDFDAIFVACEDVDYVRNQTRGIPHVYTMNDFPFVKSTLCGNCKNMAEIDLLEFIVEEIILALCDTFQASFPSSIGDMVLHHRLEEFGRQPKDVEYYELYDKRLWELMHIRFEENPKPRQRPWNR